MLESVAAAAESRTNVREGRANWKTQAQAEKRMLSELRDIMDRHTGGEYHVRLVLYPGPR